MRIIGAAAISLWLLAGCAANPVETALPLPADNICGDASHQIIRTPRLGLQFVQNDRVVPMCLSNQGERVSVGLLRAPFEIRVPREAWSDRRPNAALQVAVSDEPGFADLLRVGDNIDETPYFRRYSGMADYAFGSGSLATSRATPESGRGQDYGHNYIVDGRFNASGPGYRGVYVARIQRRFGEEDLMRNDRVVAMVFYLDQRVLPQAGATETGEQDTLTHREVDIVNATFADAGH